MIRIGDTFNGRYEILKEIGHGGMSTVFLAMDNRMNKQWAIKEIRRSGRDANDEMYSHSLQAEANMMKALDHGALPHIQDIIDQGETFCVVMDYIEGDSLDRVINEYGAQPEEKVLEWAMQICDVLSYLHSQHPPIIYRDMKPGNVMLKPDGNIKIIDFGIAREYKQNMADTTVLGTRGYAPPEQYNGRTDPRSDIYALGMTMHHLLTGLDPRAKDYEYRPVRQIRPEISDGVEAIIEKCVQPAAENRYQTCADLMYDLQHPELVTKGHKRRQRRRLWSFISCLILTAVFAVAGLMCGRQAENINNSSYDWNIAKNDEEDILKGIDIYPSRVEGFERLVEVYSSQTFGTEQHEALKSRYNLNNLLNEAKNTPAEVAELNYKIGALYLASYDGGEDNNFRNRINKAYDYFKSNETDERLKDVQYEDKTNNEYLYHICVFNKDYIFDGSTKEAIRSDYEELIDIIDKLVKNSKGLQDRTANYTKLSIFDAMLNLLHDQRSKMSELGVDKNSVWDLMGEIKTETERTETSKERNQEIRDKILGKIDGYMDDILNDWDKV